MDELSIGAIIVGFIFIAVVVIKPIYHGDVDDENPEYAVGDLILFDGNHIGGTVVRTLTCSKYSHWGIINRIDGDGKPYIMHISPKAVSGSEGDIREDYIFGQYFQIWAHAIYHMKQRNVYKEIEYKELDVYAYSKYKYHFFSSIHGVPFNCFTFIHYALEKYGVTMNIITRMRANFNKFINLLVDDSLFYAPVRIYSNKCVVDKTYLINWFYLDNKNFR